MPPPVGIFQDEVGYWATGSATLNQDEGRGATMKPLRLMAVGLAVLAFATATLADRILFESATLGETGVVPSPETPATNVNQFVFVGARFELTEPVLTSSIGGHFVGSGTFFGAIVSLTGPDDLPDSSDLSTPDVLGDTLLTFPDPSDVVYGELELELDPGWYGVVFGGGLFATQGDGGIPRTGTIVGADPLIGWSISAGWGPRNASLGHYHAVFGRVVPEPATFATCGILICLLSKSPRWQAR
ncbi:hypothetical protein MalM25_20820 [Planctomycetes bacterium MalM25]|nr:hypothetical protein MalM25_20820 [Planctomycetes bacterium MalM25]